MNKATAIYMRVSTGEQRLDSQKQELLNFCRSRRWHHCVVFTDRISGAKTKRPGLGTLMKQMREGRVERLVCLKLDRLGRSLTHLAMVLDEMNKLEVPLICTSQGIDTSDDNPVGKLQLGVLMAVAEFERDIIRERVNAGLAAAKSRGVKLGRPPFLNRRKAEVNALFRKGAGVRAIGRKLKMAPSSVHSLLSKRRTKSSNCDRVFD